MSRTNDPVYVRKRMAIRVPGAVCVVCGEPIDLELPQYHQMSFQAGHLDAVALGGDNRGDLAPMHRLCNQKMGTKPLDAVRHDPHSRRHY